MKIVFGVFKTDMPDDWIDISTICYAVPPKVVAGGELAGKTNDASPGNVTIRWEPQDGLDAHEYIEKRAKFYEAEVPGFRLMDSGDLGKNGAELPFIIFGGETDEHAFVQIMLAKECGNFFVVTVGTALAETFHLVNDQFVEIARKVKLLGQEDIDLVEQQK